MNRLLAASLLLCSFSSYAYTDAQVMKALFNDEEFTTELDETKINDIKITEDETGKKFKVVINSKARLVDGCSFSADVKAVSDRYAGGPATTRVRTALVVSKFSKSCGRR